MATTSQTQDNQKLFKNTSWLLGVEFLAKASRLVTLLVAAYMLMPADYGIAMLALACHDIIRALMRSGAGSQVIQCGQNDLKRYAQNATIIQWGLGAFLCLLQFILAIAIAAIYEQQALTQLLQVMAFTYLLFPIVSIRVFLNQRTNDLKRFSWVNGVCIISENLSIPVFLYFDAGIMAFAYSKWVFAVLWVVLFLRLPQDNFGFGFHWNTFKTLCKTSYQLVATELLKTSRQHLDTFIAGKVLTPDLFGLYSFAKSSGIGLSQSISNAFNGALFPFMCKLNRAQQLQQKVVMIYSIATVIGALFLIQAALAPWYIPLLFSDNWQNAIPVVATLCFAALGGIWADTLCGYLRAQGLFSIEMNVRLLCIFSLLISLFIFPIGTPQQFANAFLIGSFIWLLPVISIPVIRQHHKVFSQ